MSRKRRRKIVSVIPRLGAVIGRGARALLAHPQPLIVMVATIACAVGLWQGGVRSGAVTEGFFQTDGNRGRLLQTADSGTQGALRQSLSFDKLRMSG